MSEPHPATQQGAEPPEVDYEAVQASPEFQELRSRFRRFVFPVFAIFMVWFLTYVILAAYAHDFMAIPVFGNVNVGILLGLGQFVTTFAITMIYVRFANRRLDPLSLKIRANLEESVAGRDDPKTARPEVDEEGS